MERTVVPARCGPSLRYNRSVNLRCLLVILAGCSFQLDVGGLAGEDAPDGDGVIDEDAPADASMLASACAQLALGSEHTCVLRRSDQNVYCWGLNGYQELGGSSATTRVNLPPSVDLSSRAYTTCAVGNDGLVRCWGYNDHGQIGDGTVGGTRPPTVVSGMTGAVQVAAGRSHTCARRANGTLRCWGSNAAGQLGDGTFTSKPSATTDVNGLTGMERVTTGGSHTCAHGPTSGWCWGDNEHGQLGDGTLIAKSSPLEMPVTNVQRTGPASFSALAVVGAHTCSIVGAGEVWCWGDNAYGQLGNGTTTDSLTPVRATGLTDAVELAMGRWTVCALRGTGQVSCWGRNYYGEAGVGTTQVQSTPGDIGLVNVAALGAGGFHSCALNAMNELYCWGDNSSAQLGDGTTTQRTAPVRSNTICP